MEVTRRGLVTGAALGGGLIVAWWFLPRSYPNPLEPSAGEHVFDAWIKIGEDSVVTVAVPQLEMGQGITTLLPQIIARELGADWRQVAVEPAPVAAAYPNVPLAKRWTELWEPLAAGISETTDDMLARQFARNSRFNATADGTSKCRLSDWLKTWRAMPAPIAARSAIPSAKAGSKNSRNRLKLNSLGACR